MAGIVCLATASRAQTQARGLSGNSEKRQDDVDELCRASNLTEHAGFLITPDILELTRLKEQ